MHPDHPATSKLVTDAYYMASLPLVDIDAPPCEVENVYYFGKPTSSFEPTRYIDITDFQDTKERAIEQHESQVAFVEAFAHHLPPETRSETGLQTWTAPTSDYGTEEIRTLAQADVDALELALLTPEDAVYLTENGVSNFLLGSIVLGETAESVGELTDEFVTALEGFAPQS